MLNKAWEKRVSVRLWWAGETVAFFSILLHCYSMPSMGLLAVAYNFRGIRPALYARRPASTAYFMASAMAIGSFAPAMAVFIKTASHPYSMANAASDAVPTPASTITGTLTVSRMILRL